VDQQVVDRHVSIRAHYERFPATVKGAFVLRGADGSPHQVRLVAARAAECSGHGERSAEFEPVVLDVAPTLDLFVPFEVGLTDLSPGWYQLECDVVVDGVRGTVRPGDRFAVPWPRSSVRRGSARIGEKAGDVVLRQIECAADSMRITYEAPAAPAIRLRVDGSSHAVIEIDHDGEAGAGRIVAYPVLRSQERLSVEVKGATAVEVPLP
jgi:hypothetical protein